jgi:UDP-3-O-[3-hydroxymyristoyl] glucosamine N-acyltransferase
MEFKAVEIAAFLKGEIEGDDNVKVSDVSKIEEGKKGTLAFLANPKYENYLYSTEASIVLINKDLVLKYPVNTTLIRVENAYESFARLLDLYIQATRVVKTGIEQPSFIDPTAHIGENVYIGAFSYIGKNVRIGNNCQIFPQVYIGDGSLVGEGCVIYPGVKLYVESQMGKNCIIHSGAVIGSDGFGFAPQNDGTYKKIPQIGNVIIEDDVEIGANTTIDCGSFGSTVIKKGVKLDNLIQIAHNCEVGENTVIAAQTGMAGTTRLGKNCRVGGQVGFAGHINVGHNVQIGGQSGVTNHAGDNAVLLGSPAINIKDYIKASVIFKILPELRKDILTLQKEVKQLNLSTQSNL